MLVFQFDANYGIVDKVSSTELTNSGVVFKNTNKGIFADPGIVGYLNRTAVGGNYNTILLNIYVKIPFTSALQPIFSNIGGFGTTGLNFVGLGNATSTVSDETLFIYNNGGATTGTYIKDSIFPGLNQIVLVWDGVSKYNVFLNGTQRTTFNRGIDSTIFNGPIYLGRNSGTDYPRGNILIKSCKIFDNSITQNEITNEYKKILQLKPLLEKKTNIIKESNRAQVNFDLNIDGNNYVTVADNTTLDFGTGSFSMYREDRYPQRQTAASARKFSKGSTASGGCFLFFNNTTDTSSLIYQERTSAFSPLSITGIPNGDHKFLFYRDTGDSKAHLWMDGAEVATSAVYTFRNIDNAFSLVIGGAYDYTLRTSGAIRNFRMWKGVVKTWNQAINNDRTGQVLDLPMNEGGGTTCYDKSGNGNNGTVNTTAGIKPWKIIQVKSDVILRETFIYDKADGNTVVPQGWIKGTGSYKLVTETTGNSIIKKGQKYLQCTSNGTILLPQKQAYGTFEYSLYKGSDTSTCIVRFISSTDSTSNLDGYGASINSAEQVNIAVVNGGSASSILFSANSYISVGVWYRLRITRTTTGVFTLYIKGGGFTNRTLVSVSGGGGSNPVTNNTYTSSNFFLVDLDALDRIADIVIKQGVEV